MIKIMFIILLVFLELMLLFVNCKLYNFKLEDYKPIGVTLLKIVLLLFIIVYFVKLFLINSVPNSDVIDESFSRFKYIAILFILVIFNNYFATRSNEFRLCIKTFLDETFNFFKDNFSLDLITFILLVFTKNNKDVKIALITSYVFFALTTIHSSYKDIIKDNNKKIKKHYIIFQFIFNYSLLQILTGVELILYSKDIEPKFLWYIITFFVVLCTNFFLPSLESCFEYFKKNIKKKVTD